MPLARFYRALGSLAATPWNVYAALLDRTARGIINVHGVPARAARFWAAGLMAVTALLVLAASGSLLAGILTLVFVVPFGIRATFFALGQGNSPFEKPRAG